MSDLELIESAVYEHGSDHDAIVKELAPYGIDEHEITNYYYIHLK